MITVGFLLLLLWSSFLDDLRWSKASLSWVRKSNLSLAGSCDSIPTSVCLRKKKKKGKLWKLVSLLLETDLSNVFFFFFICHFTLVLYSYLLNFITDKIYCLIRGELFETGNVSSSFSVVTENSGFLPREK